MRLTSVNVGVGFIILHKFMVFPARTLKLKAKFLYTFPPGSNDFKLHLHSKLTMRVRTRPYIATKIYCLSIL